MFRWNLWFLGTLHSRNAWHLTFDKDSHIPQPVLQWFLCKFITLRKVQVHDFLKNICKLNFIKPLIFGVTDIPTGNSRDSTAGNPKTEKQSSPRTSLGHPPTPEPSDSSCVLLPSDQHSHGVLCQINSQTVFFLWT